jgi:hypothetical protein
MPDPDPYQMNGISISADLGIPQIYFAAAPLVTVPILTNICRYGTRQRQLCTLHSTAKKIRPLEKKLGRKPATLPNHLKKSSKNL